MANIKFSAFTQLAPIDQGLNGSYIVGYEGDANTNNRWTFGEVAIGLKAVTATPYSVYARDGSLESTRSVTFSAHDLKFIATGNGKLWYQDGNQAAGYVLKSDADGEASWAAETDTDTGITSVTYAVGADETSPLTGTITSRALELTSNKYGGATKVGYVPEGGTAITFLRGDGTWVTPTATTAASDGSPSTGQLQYNNGSNGFAASASLAFTGSGATPDTLTLTDTLDIKGDGTNPGTLKLYCESTTTPHAVSILGPVHSGATPYSIRLPKEIATQAVYSSGGRILESNASGALQWINTLSVSGNLYTADGTTGAGRIVGITDTLTFEESSGNVDMFNMNVNGSMFLGKGAANTVSTNVVIGTEAGVNSTNGYGFGNYNSILIGYQAYSNSSYNENVGVGKGVYTGNHGVSIGSQAVAMDNSVSIGFKAGFNPQAGGYPPHYNNPTKGINIGKLAKGEGTNNIVLNTTGSDVTPSTANAFGVYMTSASTPDFVVVGGGESTLNTSLKVTGQAYTELNSLSNTLTINWNDSNVQAISGLTGSHTFTPTNPKAGATYILTLIQTGAVTATWGSYIKWAAPDSAATPPTLSGSGKTDVITLICWSATANSGAGGYYGSITKDLS